MKPYGLASFDSAAAMLRATAQILKGQDFAGLGQPKYLQHVVRFADLLPTRLRRAAFAAATGMEAIPQRSIERVRAAAIAEWATSLYPERDYPAVIIGSSSGALVHLAAALKAPLLPQTFLVPVRRQSGGPDDPKGDLVQACAAGKAFLDANPDVQLHQMHDPNQDRLSLDYVTYFRPKFVRLPPAYRKFIHERLKPGSTVLIAECTRRWPTTRVADRHVFQFGAVGGMTAPEYFAQDGRIAAYLARYGVPLRHWDPPEPDDESPEAEWGFEAALRDEIEELASEKALRVVRLLFADPEELSPLTADFYRQWYRNRGLPDDQLLVESFILLEPYWALRTGSVPFWMTFNMRPSLESLQAYLAEAAPFERVGMMLFPHGTLSIGLPTIDEWRKVLHNVPDGAFLGVNERAFPSHFSALARYYFEAKKSPVLYPSPSPLGFETFAQFCAETKGRYSAKLVGPAGP